VTVVCSNAQNINGTVPTVSQLTTNVIKRKIVREERMN
jgi:hypothetical protein